MTIYDLKPKFQALLRPLVQRLSHKNITPNQVTWFALIASILYGLLIMLTNGATWTLFLLPLFFFIRMALNAIDGMLAREHNMQTKEGAILNELSDVIADVALYLPFAFIVGVNAVWVVLFVVIGIFTEMAGVVSQTVYSERRYDGPMGKSDRSFLVGFIALILGFGVQAGVWVDALFIIGTLLGVWTLFNRTKKVA